MKKFIQKNGNISVQAFNGKWMGSLPNPKNVNPPNVTSIPHTPPSTNDTPVLGVKNVESVWEKFQNATSHTPKTSEEFSPIKETAPSGFTGLHLTNFNNIWESEVEKFNKQSGTQIAYTLAQHKHPHITREQWEKTGERLLKEAYNAEMHTSSFSESKVYSWVDDQILYTLTSQIDEKGKLELVKKLEKVAVKHSKKKNVNYAQLYAWKNLEQVAIAQNVREVNSNPKTVAVDVDGVLYDVDGVMWRWLVNQGFEPPAHEVRTYSMGENWGVPEEKIQEEFGKAVDAGFMFRYGDTYRESVNAVRKIYNQGHRIVLVTARDLKGREVKCSQATLKWLRDNNIPFDDLYLTHEKEKVNFDILIDDAPGNVEKVMSWGKRGYILHRPWNRDEGDGYDRGTWVDILMHLEGFTSDEVTNQNKHNIVSPVHQVGTIQPNENEEGKNRPTRTA